MKMRLMISLMLGGVLFLSACSESDETIDSPQPPTSQLETNPFEETDFSQVFGSLSHGATNKEIDENGNRLPLCFQGEEIHLDYHVTAEGNAKNVGFLLFVDGVAQPYSLDPSSNHSDMTVLNLENNGQQEEFTFHFTPIKGNKGDTLTLSVLSVYNPDFKPDMIDTNNYGMFHSILLATYEIFLEEDVNQVSSNNSVLEISTSQQEITEDFLKTKLSTGLIDVPMEMLDQNVYSLIYFNGKEVLSGNLDISEISDNQIKVQHLLCGVSGSEYTTTFYADHEAVTESVDTVLEKGKISVIDLNIDKTLLENATTFYAISIPTNADDFENSNDILVMAQKTPSILLFKGDISHENET